MSDPNQPPENEGNPPPAGQPYPPPPPPPPPGPGSYGPPPPGGWQQPGSMPPPPQVTGGVGQPADLMPRFLARLVDFVLLAVVNGLLVSFLVVGLILGSDAGSLSGWGAGNGPWAANAVSSVLAAAIGLAYFTLMESSRGQTIGKMLVKLQTRGPDGGNPTFEQALKRNAFTAIGVLGVIPFLGFLSGLLSLAAVIMIAVTISNNTATRRGWHDDFAGGTQVIRIG